MTALQLIELFVTVCSLYHEEHYSAKDAGCWSVIAWSFDQGIIDRNEALALVARYV